MRLEPIQQTWIDSRDLSDRRTRRGDAQLEDAARRTAGGRACRSGSVATRRRGPARGRARRLGSGGGVACRTRGAPDRARVVAPPGGGGSPGHAELAVVRVTFPGVRTRSQAALMWAARRASPPSSCDRWWGGRGGVETLATACVQWMPHRATLSVHTHAQTRCRRPASSVLSSPLTPRHPPPHPVDTPSSVEGNSTKGSSGASGGSRLDAWRRPHRGRHRRPPSSASPVRRPRLPPPPATTGRTRTAAAKPPD